MELRADDKDKMSQCYVVEKRESAEGMQERDMSKTEHIHLKSCIISGGEENRGKTI